MVNNAINVQRTTKHNLEEDNRDGQTWDEHLVKSKYRSQRHKQM